MDIEIAKRNDKFKAAAILACLLSWIMPTVAYFTFVADINLSNSRYTPESLFTGIAVLCFYGMFIMAPLALVLSIVTLVKQKKNEEKLKSIITVTVFSAIPTVVMVYVFYLFVQVW